MNKCYRLLAVVKPALESSEPQNSIDSLHCAQVLQAEIAEMERIIDNNDHDDNENDGDDHMRTSAHTCVRPYKHTHDRLYVHRHEDLASSRKEATHHKTIILSKIKRCLGA